MISIRVPHLLSFLFAAVMLVFASPAFAQNDDLDKRREQARPIALEGIQLLDDGKFNEAIAKLEEAERIFHAPTHLLYIAKARRELGELLTAYNTYIDILIEEIPNYAPEQFQKAKAEAQREAEALRSSIATVEVKVEGVSLDQVTITLNGNPVPVKRIAYPVGVNAGSHTLEASAAGTEGTSEKVEAIEGQSQPVTLILVVNAATTGGPDAPRARTELSHPGDHYPRGGRGGAYRRRGHGGDDPHPCERHQRQLRRHAMPARPAGPRR